MICRTTKWAFFPGPWVGDRPSRAQGQAQLQSGITKYPFQLVQEIFILSFKKQLKYKWCELSLSLEQVNLTRQYFEFSQAQLSQVLTEFSRNRAFIMSSLTVFYLKQLKSVLSYQHCTLKVDDMLDLGSLLVILMEYQSSSRILAKTISSSSRVASSHLYS